VLEGGGSPVGRHLGARVIGGRGQRGHAIKDGWGGGRRWKDKSKSKTVTITSQMLVR
jgi:hypothetical protein